ncbi:hypothetical protein PPERSA_08719 [Pseudocohnilembus persalinus]|uniref:Tetratricopeptide repeat protein n=1 Tax=Pseudocohnilembus persalinus TaxID=266149 RepID=A0A0V0QXS8_PSEPJ|nr:hypothetical protein PPERSA_08719 [Pseudocohnilembus persalinus]|eukprot:KRX07042.1 hypothetical protein PPERSA_08719 [Pseudocohnilembus persalinus]
MGCSESKEQKQNVQSSRIIPLTTPIDIQNQAIKTEPNYIQQLQNQDIDHSLEKLENVKSEENSIKNQNAGSLNQIHQQIQKFPQNKEIKQDQQINKKHRIKFNIHFLNSNEQNELQKENQNEQNHSKINVFGLEYESKQSQGVQIQQNINKNRNSRSRKDQNIGQISPKNENFKEQKEYQVVRVISPVQTPNQKQTNLKIFKQNLDDQNKILNETVNQDQNQNQQQIQLNQTQNQQQQNINISTNQLQSQKQQNEEKNNERSMNSQINSQQQQQEKDKSQNGSLFNKNIHQSSKQSTLKIRKSYQQLQFIEQLFSKNSSLISIDKLENFYHQNEILNQQRIDILNPKQSNQEMLQLKKRKQKIQQLRASISNMDLKKCKKKLEEQQYHEISEQQQIIFRMGQIALQNENLDECTQLLEKIIDISQKNNQYVFNAQIIYFTLASIYFSQQNFEKALYYYKNLYAYIEKASLTNIDENLQHIDDHLISEEKILKKIAKCQTNLQLYSDAKLTYQLQITKYPLSSKTYRKIGFLFFQIYEQNQNKQEIDQGINWLYKAHSLEPQNLETLQQLADAYLIFSEFDQEIQLENAIKYYQIIIDHENQDYLTHSYLGKSQQTEQNEKNNQEREKTENNKLYSQFEELIELQETDYLKPEQILYLIGFCYFKLENYDQSLLFFKNSLKKNPKLEQSLYNIGNIYVIQHEFQLTKQYFSDCFKYFSNKLALFNQANCYLALVKYEKVKELFDQFVQIDEFQNVDQNLQIARYYLEQKFIPEAKYIIENLKKHFLLLDNKQVHKIREFEILQAQMYIKLNQNEKAIKILKKYWEINDQDDDLHLVIAELPQIDQIPFQNIKKSSQFFQRNSLITNF